VLKNIARGVNVSIQTNCARAEAVPPVLSEERGRREMTDGGDLKEAYVVPVQRVVAGLTVARAYHPKLARFLIAGGLTAPHPDAPY
jgi:hypothetical protein